MIKRLFFAMLVAGVATAASAADAKEEVTPIIWSQQTFQAAAHATVEAHLLAIDAGGATLTTRYGRVHAASVVAPLPYTFGTASWQQLPNALVLLGTDMPYHHYTRPDPLAFLNVKPDGDE